MSINIEQVLTIQQLNDRRARLAYYKLTSDWNEALTDKDSVIRLEAYRVLGWTDQALDDKDWEIRLEAYRSLGFTKKALTDKHWHIRQTAYRVLGYNEEALNDEDPEIRQEAEIYFQVKAQLEMITSKIYQISHTNSFESTKAAIEDENRQFDLGLGMWDPDIYVPTSDGYKKVNDLIDGDKIVTSDGKEFMLTKVKA